MIFPFSLFILSKYREFIATGFPLILIIYDWSFITLSFDKFIFFFFNSVILELFKLTSFIFNFNLFLFLLSLFFNSLCSSFNFVVIFIKLNIIFSCFDIFSCMSPISVIFSSFLSFIFKAMDNKVLILFICDSNIFDSIFNSFIFVINKDFFNLSIFSFSNLISLFVCLTSFFIFKNKFPVDEFLLLDNALA